MNHCIPWLKCQQIDEETFVKYLKFLWKISVDDVQYLVQVDVMYWNYVFCFSPIVSYTMHVFDSWYKAMMNFIWKPRNAANIRPTIQIGLFDPSVITDTYGEVFVELICQ